jgi:hypothetical protein
MSGLLMPAVLRVRNALEQPALAHHAQAAAQRHWQRSRLGPRSLGELPNFVSILERGFQQASRVTLT